MSTCKPTPWVFFTTIAVSALPAIAGPDLGRKMPPEEVAAMDISITPTGTNLPPGNGTPAEGKVVYEEKCMRCHGPEAAGGEGSADPLVGGIGSLSSEAPKKTVGSYWPYATTLFDYTRRAMPLDAPMSLTNDDVYAVSAYILHLNGIIEADAVVNAQSLPKVEMPNRDGFVKVLE